MDTNTSIHLNDVWKLYEEKVIKAKQQQYKRLFLTYFLPLTFYSEKFARK